MDERIEFYNKIYSDNPNKWVLDWRDKTAFSILSLHTEEPATFLDIGCGNGHTIEFFSKRWPGTAYYGIDLSDVAIGFAKERVPEAEFIRGAFDEMYSAWPKDVVVLMGVAEHFEDLIPSLLRLKMFGKLIYIESPNCLAYSDNKEEGFRNTNNETGQPEWHLRRSTWEKHIKGSGLEIVESYSGRTPETLFIWVLK